MSMLEHKIPPPVVGVLIGAAMWLAARVSPQINVEAAARIAIALAFAGFGLAIALSGVVAFRQARTTVNPLKPEAASALVVHGVYRYTRNPMYLGFAAALVGWAVYLATPVALLGPALFAWFITCFQIVPEERVLRNIFGQEFADYQSRVRRWL